MFGAHYSRKTFWIVTLLTLFVGGFLINFVSLLEAGSGGNGSLELIFSLILSFLLINTLANRIRDYGSNPWLALWSLIPLVGLVQALYFGIQHKKAASSGQNASFNTQSAQQQAPKSPEIKDFQYTPNTSTKADTHSNSATASSRPRLPLKDFN